MKTAIQTACNDIIDELIDTIELAHLTKIISIMHKHLETEEQHIINSWENGYQHGSGVNIDKDKYHGVQYYTSTFSTTNKETLK